MIKETLRQICIRDHYNHKSLVQYLVFMKQKAENLQKEGIWDSKNLEAASWEMMSKVGLNLSTLRKCYTESFQPYFNENNSSTQVDEQLDDNLLLKQEQKVYFEVTNYNVIPLIKINNVIYDQTISIR